MSTDIERLGARLVGGWVTEATHPELPGTVITGSTVFEWLEQGRVLVVRSRYDVDQLRMYYFDARGVHRVYEFSVAADGWVASMGRQAPSHSYTSADAPFSQRTTCTFDARDETVTGQGRLSYDDTMWRDDLTITYRRVP